MVERQLYYREGSKFTKLLTPLEVELSTENTEAKLLSEGVHSFKARHIAFGDAQIPDVDQKAVEAVLRVNDEWKATNAWIMGDMINATTVGKFGFPASYDRDLDSEVQEGRGLMKLISSRLREANPDVKIKYLEGNHEFRLQKYLDKHAREIALLKEADGTQTISLPRLLGLYEQGIEWVPYWEDEHIEQATILHGNLVRVKGGYTAQAYIDRYGETTIAGHTHRLAMVARTQSGEEKFGIETGSLCKKKMEVPYVREGQVDWQQGFSLVGVDHKDTLYPAVVPIVNGRAMFGSNLYEGKL